MSDIIEKLIHKFFLNVKNRYIDNHLRYLKKTDFELYNALITTLKINKKEVKMAYQFEVRFHVKGVSGIQTQVITAQSVSKARELIKAQYGPNFKSFSSAKKVG
ncbi:MAG: hypothetical protein HN952_04775 [Candidatus Cloacimonetes bacterium]|jgi:hypothetical protein|nr:hypothetical protein [Candidatus Cloacimonadota bacterium]